MQLNREFILHAKMGKTKSKVRAVISDFLKTLKTNRLLDVSPWPTKEYHLTM